MTAAGLEVRREYPAVPIVGVAGVVVRDGQVLLIRRGREPMLGRWGLPGGVLEVGETMADGVAREVLEETGIQVRPLEIVATLDRIVRDEVGRVRFHYVLVDWLCTVEMGSDGASPLAGDDAAQAIWAEGGEIGIGLGDQGSAPGGVGAYGLEAATLRVIEDGLRRAEGMGLWSGGA